MRRLAVGAALLLTGLCDAQDETGLALRFTVETALGPESDERRARLVALTVGDGERPTPFLPAGEFTAEWRGEIVVDERDKLAFAFVGFGRFELEIDGDVWLSGASVSGEPLTSERRRLRKGPHSLRATWVPAPGKPRWMRLEWEGRSFRREPVPARAFRPAELARDAVLRRHGRTLVATARCTRCHDVDAPDDALLMPELAMAGPDLDGVGRRLEAAWLHAYLRDVRATRPHARMPQMLSGSPETIARDADDLVAFLAASVAGPHWEGPAGGDAAKGAHVFHDLGCIACHQIADEPVPDASDPIDLRGVGRKYRRGALAAFLHDPRRHDAWIRMPDLALTPREAADLAAFLRTLPGDDELDEPKPGDAERGRRRFEELGCAACHEHAGTRNLLTANPLEAVLGGAPERGCLAESAELRGNAPDFRLSAADRAGLAEFAKSLPDSLLQASSVEFAARQIAERRCTACHGLDRRTDDWTRRAALLEPLGVGAAPHADDHVAVAQLRPDLTLAGEKLEVGWLDDYLAGRRTQRPRPWLRARMPSFPLFSDGLAAGLAASHGTPYGSAPASPPDPDLAALGRKLTGAEGGFACVLCHAIGDQPPLAVFEVQGVDLALSGDRLRRSWFERWMWDPPRIDAGSKMPRYADPDGKTAFREILDGDADRQFDAIWHFIRSIH